jgi:hypothetical protein
MLVSGAADDLQSTGLDKWHTAEKVPKQLRHLSDMGC